MMIKNITFFKNSAFLALFFVCIGNLGMAQNTCKVPDEKPAKKAVESVLNNDYTVSDILPELRDLLTDYPDNGALLGALARVQFQVAQDAAAPMDNCIKTFRQALNICPDYDPSLLYLLGVAYYASGNLDASVKTFRKFLAVSDNPRDPDFEARYENAQKMLPKIVLQRDLNKDAQVAVEPFLLKTVSTKNSEYLPVLSPDNSLLLYTRMERVKRLGDKVTREVEQLTLSNKLRRQFDFDLGAPMDYPINKYTSGNYGGASLSINNKELYYTICLPDADGYRNCNIYRSNKIINVKDGDDIYYLWTDPEKLGENINEADSWQSQPTLSTDGLLLLFAKFSANTQGTDIYYSTRSSTKSPWSKAQPLPGYINTKDNEKAPFIHPDTKTLYFSSDGLGGAGGYDIYMTQQIKGSWTDPLNLGGAINTGEDEISFVVSLDGMYGMFASNKSTPDGSYDLYAIELHEKVKPDSVTILRGIVENPTEDTEVEISNNKGEVIDRATVDADDGSYAILLPKKKLKEELIVAVKKPGYAFDSRVVTIDSKDGGLLQAQEMKLEEIQLDKPYRINDIFFETNSSNLTVGSKQILDKFSEFLEINPTFKVLILGHTDNVGGAEPNRILSLNRSKSVKVYLGSKGVDIARLTAKGYGETKPIADNTTEEGRAQNRRTEFVITSK